MKRGANVNSIHVEFTLANRNLIFHSTSTFGFFSTDKSMVQMNASLGGGALYDVGCYPVNLFSLITGREPLSVSTQALVENDIDVMLSALLKYDNGIICSLNCWFNSFIRVNAEIVGTKGIIKIPDTYFGSAGKIEVITEGGICEFEIPESNDYISEIEDFSDAIINKRNPKFSMDETLRNMRVIDKIIGSIR